MPSRLYSVPNSSVDLARISQPHIGYQTAILEATQWRYMLKAARLYRVAGTVWVALAVLNIAERQSRELQALCWANCCLDLRAISRLTVLDRASVSRAVSFSLGVFVAAAVVVFTFDLYSSAVDALFHLRYKRLHILLISANERHSVP
jgi:hypothetical protein